MLYTSDFIHLYEINNLLFISMNLVLSQALMYVPVWYVYREKINSQFITLSSACFFIFSMIIVDFLERFFFRTTISNFYLIFLGIILIYSLSNYFVYGRDRQFQLFIISEGLFMMIWFQVTQFTTFYLYEIFYFGSYLTFYILLLIGVPVFIILYKKFIIYHSLSWNKIILLSLISCIVFIFLNSTNVLLFSFKKDILRIIHLDTFFGKILFSNFSKHIDIVHRNVDSQLPYVWIFGFAVTVPMLSLFELAIKRQLDNRYIHLQKKREEELKKYIQMIESINQETRQLQHDINNVLGSLGMYIYQEELDIESMRDYYEQVNQEFGLRRITKIPNGKLTYLKNPEILGLVLDKLMRAKELDIQLNLEIEEAIDFPSKRLVPIVRIIAILLDNALEESQKYPGAVVRLAFVSVGEKQILTMVGNYTMNADFIGQYLTGTIQSDKGAGRGQGLRIIQSLIKENKQLNLDCKQTNQLVLFSFLVDGKG